MNPRNVRLTDEQLGQPALAARVVDAESRATNRLAERGFAFARIAERQAVVDHETRTMDVTYIIDPGPLTRYGDVSVQGLDRVTEQLVRNRIPWKPGEEYRPAEIEDARSSISDLGTFLPVRVGLDREPGPDGVTPVTVSVRVHVSEPLYTLMVYSQPPCSQHV